MIDLHMHSRYSDDGEFTPECLVFRCKEQGIRIVSVTDHNCVRANQEARKAAESLGLSYISGGEFDCMYHGRNFHMLGYGIDCENEAFAKLERAVMDQSRRASLEMLEKTRKLGFSVTEEEMDRVSSEAFWKGKWTGEMFGEVLLSKPEYEDHPLLKPYRKGGERSDNPYVNFYWDFYSQGKPCHAGIKIPDMKTIVDIIHQNHGLAVLAHPCVNLKGKEQLLKGIVSLGIDGMEAFSSYHTPEQALERMEQAKAYGLFYTCGSDFHGKTKPSISLGGHGCGASQEELEQELGRLLERAK